MHYEPTEFICPDCLETPKYYHIDGYWICPSCDLVAREGSDEWEWIDEPDDVEGVE